MASLAVTAFLSTSLQESLVFDRPAIASGQVWRLLTGHFVHFSPSHLIVNLAVLVTAGVLVENKNLRFYPPLLVAAMTVIGAGLFITEPALRQYGGLSGVSLAVVVYLGLWGLHEPGAWRWLCAIVLSTAVLKTGAELMTGHSFFFDPASAGFVPVPLSHALGMLTSLALYAGARLCTRPPSSA